MQERSLTLSKRLCHGPKPSMTTMTKSRRGCWDMKLVPFNVPSKRKKSLLVSITMNVFVSIISGWWPRRSLRTSRPSYVTRIVSIKTCKRRTQSRSRSGGKGWSIWCSRTSTSKQWWRSKPRSNLRTRRMNIVLVSVSWSKTCEHSRCLRRSRRSAKQSTATPSTSITTH